MREPHPTKLKTVKTVIYKLCCCRLVPAINCGVNERCGGGHYLEISVEEAVVDGFGEVVGLDVVGIVEVGEGSGDFEDFVVGTAAEA